MILERSDRKDAGGEASAGQRALNLLLKLANSVGTPEEFKSACGAWAEHAVEAGQSPGFNEVAARIFLAAGERPPPRGLSPASRARSPVREVGSFTADNHGRISAIDEGARRRLGVAVGDQAAEVMTDPAQPGHGFRPPLVPDCLIELRSKSGARLLGHMTLGPHADKSMRVAIFAADLSPLLEAYLRWNLGLTMTEIEVLRLVLQRSSTAEIAAERGVRVNTVRTHINSVIRKFRCRSMTEVIAAIYELTLIPEDHYCEALEDTKSHEPARGPILKLAGGADLEYVRHGDPAARPLMLLHSIEYAADPPKEFVKTAIERGYCVFAPMRPGFGRSTAAPSIRAAAEALGAALEKLEIREVAVVAFSTAAPVALQMTRSSRRVGSLAVVNFLMTAKNKMEFARPKWLRGLLDLAVRSNESYNYALKVTRSMVRLAGARRFYGSFYAGQKHDLAYMEAHAEEIERAARLLVTSDAETLRMDLIASFIAEPDIEAAKQLGDRFAVIFGDAAHGVPEELANAVAAEAGLRNFIIREAGRNCVFHRPAAFFDILDTLTRAAARDAAQVSA